MSQKTQLDMFLAGMYRADVMGDGNYQEAADRARKMIRSSDRMRSEAKQRLEEGRRVVAKKKLNAHIETKVVQYLEELLKEPA